MMTESGTYHSNVLEERKGRTQIQFLYKCVISRNAKPLKGYVPDPLGTVLPKTGSAIFAQDRRREVGESAQTLHRGAQGRAQGD